MKDYRVIENTYGERKRVSNGIKRRRKNDGRLSNREHLGERKRVSSGIKRRRKNEGR